MNDRKERNRKYRHQDYPDVIPTHAEMSKLSDTGSLADVMKFSEDHKRELDRESQKQKSVRKNYADDLERGIFDAGYEKPASKKKKSKTAKSVNLQFEALLKSSQIHQYAKEVETRPKRIASRKPAEPVIQDPDLDRLRIQSWYLSLLDNWYPDVANNLRDHMIAQSLGVFLKTLGKELPDDFICSLPELPPDGNAGDMLEAKIRERFRTNPLLKKKRYNLKLRNYMTGDTCPSEDTVREFAQVVPDSEHVFRSGFDGLPMWPVLDGDPVICRSFILENFSQEEFESPSEYVQTILESLLGITDQSRLPALVLELESEEVAGDLDERLAELSGSIFSETNSRKFNKSGLQTARTCLLLLALIQISPTDYVTAHKRLSALLKRLQNHNLYRNLFGLVFQIYIRQKFC